MANVDQLFAPGASTPLPQGPTSGNKVDELFGAPNAKEEQATSPLSRSRAVLPKEAKEKEIVVDRNAEVGAPSPGDIQRNSQDLGGGGIENKLREFFGAPKVGENPEYEKVVQADSPFPDVLPTVVGAKGIAKAGMALVTAITNKSAGMSLLGESKAAVGSAVETLSDDFFKVTRMAYQRRAEWLTDISNFIPKNWSEMAGRVDDFMEGTLKGPLTKDEQKMATNIQLMNAKTVKMRQAVKDLGYDVGQDEPGYVGSRLAKSTGKPSAFENIMSSAPTGKARGVSAMAPEFKPRVVHGLEGNGEQNLHLIDNQNNTFTVWRNKQKIAGGRFNQEELEQGKVSFTDTKTGEKQQFNIVPSTKRAIEEHTEVEYYHDPLLSAVTANMHVSEALHSAQFLEKLKFSPELQAMRAAPGKNFPEGWRGVDVPQLRGYKFDPKVANVIDDFALPARSGGFQELNNLSRMVVGSMFWNPLPHAFNVSAFGALEAGLMGAAKQLGHPAELVQSMLKAHSQVMNMGQDYRAAVRAGAGMQYNAIFARDFVGKLSKQLGSEPEMDAVSKAWGYANPAEMIKRVYNASSKHLWSWNDTILMHSYYARQAQGASLPEAIKDVEKIIPNYRMPSEILGSRAAAEIWKVTPTFARYHWGVLKAYGNIAKGLVGGNSTDRAGALDKLAMLAFGSTVVYPAIDHALQAITGNDQARMRRYGPFSIPDAIYRFAIGDAKYSTLSSAILGVSPVFTVPTALATGVDPYTGKHFENFGEAAKYMAQQFNPIQNITQEQSLGGRKTGGELLAEQLGIQLPSDKEKEAKQKAIDREERKKARSDE